MNSTDSGWDISDRITYLLFDNQLINETIGTPILCEILTIILAVVTIIIGAHSSIIQPINAIDPTKSSQYFHSSDIDGKKSDEKIKENQITWSMVIILPIMASISLISMYYYSKKLNNGSLEMFMNKYLIIMSFISSSFVINYLFNAINRNLGFKFDIKGNNLMDDRFSITLSKDNEIHPIGLDVLNVTLPDKTEREKIIKEERLKELRNDILIDDQIVNYYISYGQIISIISAIIFTIIYYKYNNNNKNWILNNIFGLMVVSMGISNTSIPNFQICSIFLILFFLYDIYFVFFTEIMVKVATEIEIPAKFIIPNTVSKGESLIKMSILGLGDVALPGSLIALCLRFDLFKFHQLNKDKEFHYLQPYDKRYFINSIIGYIIGLIITVRFVKYTGNGQPALLYLVPCLLISVYGTAIYLGDLKLLWGYNEIIEETKGAEDDDEGDKFEYSEETKILISDIPPYDVKEDKLDKDYNYEVEYSSSEEEEI